MPTPSLPAPSLRRRIRLPAQRARLRAANNLIGLALSSIAGRFCGLGRVFSLLSGRARRRPRGQSTGKLPHYRTVFIGQSSRTPPPAVGEVALADRLGPVARSVTQT